MREVIHGTLCRKYYPLSTITRQCKSTVGIFTNLHNNPTQQQNGRQHGNLTVMLLCKADLLYMISERLTSNSCSTEY